MSEGGSDGRSSSKPANNSTDRAPRRGGRGGRGRGRGRSNGAGRGRGGRGSIKGGTAGKNGHANGNDENTNIKHNGRSDNTKEGTKNAQTVNGDSGGRGRSSGRGRGRGRGGRGHSSGRGRGRGRGRRNNSSGRGRGRGRRNNDDDSQAPTVSSNHDDGDGYSEPNDSKPDSVNMNGHSNGRVVAFANGTAGPTMDQSSLAVPGNNGATPGTSALPSAKAGMNGSTHKDGPPTILTRQSNPPESTGVDHDAEAQMLSERLAAAALEDDKLDDNGHAVSHDAASESAEKTESKPKKSKRRPKKKKKGNAQSADAVGEEEDAAADPAADPAVKEPVEEKVSTTDAITGLKAQSVSITSSTVVSVKKNTSEESPKEDEDNITKITGKELKKGSRSSKKKKGLSKDDTANLKAARKFNSSVRSCVENSDPVTMREILRDRRNHSFALDQNVLETVMKAYIMAAMFDDALYCLRNCTLPGTLSTSQTERILQCMPQNLRNSSAYSAADMINALCIATEFDSPTSRTYFLRIVRGISLEFLEEVVSARDRICTAPCERLVRAALCVVNARLKVGKKPSELVVIPGDQLGVFVPDSMENRGIQAGDAVSLLPYAGPYPLSAESLDRNMIEATVTNINPMILRLQDKGNARLRQMLTEDINGNVYRIDKLANRMGFNRQLSAAVSIASPIARDEMGNVKSRDTKRPSPLLIKAITAMDENIDRFMSHAGRMSKGEMTTTAALCAEAVPQNFEDEYGEDRLDQDSIRASAALALDKYRSLEGLNDSQRLAVEGAASNRLTLVQGPPGSGKTAVAIRILQHWARLSSSSIAKGGNPLPILATSDSNIAVDNLVEGCAAAGLRVVRLGRPEAIRPELLRYCIDRHNNDAGRGGASRAYKERMRDLKQAQIVCCTCIGSGGDILDSMTFDRVLIDEATQATEAAVLVPLMRGCRQLVLVGDHCQLPPTVLSTRAEEEGHGVPLFSRMVACGVPPFMLDTQYRMHPAIAMFPSDLFYGGKLLNGVSAPERRPLAGFPWPREEFPVAFMPVRGTEMDDGNSKMNEAEAAAACEVVAMLMQGGQCGVSDIAVVTPYAAQARLIRRMTRRLNPAAGPPYIEVSSVDGFQGREKEAVVFSAVRSNDYGAIGFASDWRRVNVSFTRARRALIVIGNDATLRRGDPDTWGPWLAWADAHGISMEKPGIPRGRYEPEQLRRVRGGTTAAEMLKDVLERQKSQLRKAERQMQNANKNARGHIMGRDEDDPENGTNGEAGLSLEEDLAMLSNADGNWDDSDSDDDDGGRIHKSASQPTLASGSSSIYQVDDDAEEESPGAVDVWDL